MLIYQCNVSEGRETVITAIVVMNKIIAFFNGSSIPGNIEHSVTLYSAMNTLPF